MPRPRTLLLTVLPFLLHGLAREVDRGLGLLLKAEVEPAGLVVEVVRAMATDTEGGVLRVLAWVLGGMLVSGLLAWRVARRGEGAPAETGSLFLPLLLRSLLTLMALVSVAWDPTYPFGFTLPVALTQDLGPAQDVAAMATMLTLGLPRIRIPAPRPGAVFFVSFLVYALLTPRWAHEWEGHPGNEPKYLRMAVALGHDLTLNAEGVSAAMEDLPVTPLGTAVASSGRALARESWRMLAAVAKGEAGRDAIRATRITRQTIRGKDGGVYYVLAPGPSFVLAPTFRLDRALNRARGETGPIVLSVLAWNALAALLVMAVFLLVRDATDRPGLAATLAFTFALLPPFLFYFFQFYPEMTGALVLALAFRALALRPDGLVRHPWLYGLLFATLPWLHQKFLPVWFVVVATALWVAWKQGVIPRSPPRAGDEESPRVDPVDNDRSRPIAWRWLVALLLPQALSLYLTALYNFAITGSVRPDAVFLAWGPGGVTTARMGQGLLGILLDARYGILPYVPLLVLAVAGLLVGGARRFALVLPAAAVYYLTVASADNWAGAVCNLGRYFMPVAPLAVALVALALTRLSDRRGTLTLALVLGGWSALFAWALWHDPIAANDSALLLAQSAWADGNQYIPNLFIRRWADGAPGLWARILLWGVAIGMSALWWRRAASTETGKGASPVKALVGTLAVAVAFAFTLERWPPRRSAPSFTDALEVGSGDLAFATGAVRVRENEVIVGPGAAQLLVRSESAVSEISATVGGEGTLEARGMRPFLLRPTGGRVNLPLTPYHVVMGRNGRQVAFTRTTLVVQGQAVVRPGAGQQTEPDEPRAR